jgi:porin
MALSRWLGSFAACGLAALLACTSVWAEDEPGIEHATPRGSMAPTTAPDLLETPEKKPYSQPPFFRLDYSGDFWTSPGLTGDWGGARTKLAEHGLSLNVEVLQYGMSNAYGGRSTNGGMAYSGTAIYLMQIDTWRAGLWPGGYIKIRGETEFGRSINSRTGSIASPNFDALLPVPDDPGETTLTELWMMQFLSEKVYVLGGKVDLTALPGGNVFQSDRYTQFLNTAFWYPPVLMNLVPYSAMTAGVGFIPAKWLDTATLVIDSYGQPNTTGFDTAFHSPNGVTLLQNFTFHINPWDLPGNQRFYVILSSRGRYAYDDLTNLALSRRIANDTDSRFSSLRSSIRGRNRRERVGNRLARNIVSNALAPSPDHRGWSVWYNFDQYLYTEPQDKTQGVGVFGNFASASDETNPVTTFYSIGLGGKGIIPRRDKDRFGLGYYCLNMSDQFPSRFNLNTEQGVELFYNIEVTPWFHITPDIQVIVDPGAGDQKTAMVYGVRGQISF